MKEVSISIVLLFLVGCTSIEVQELDPTAGVNHVCIEENKKVIVGDFLPVVQAGFERNVITTEVFQKTMPDYCEYRLTYTALQNWDLAIYMHHAELWLNDGRTNIAYAQYHLNGKGGMALNKFASVESKMDPVIDQLLSGYSPQLVDTYRTATSENLPESVTSADSAAN